MSQRNILPRRGSPSESSDDAVGFVTISTPLFSPMDSAVTDKDDRLEFGEMKQESAIAEALKTPAFGSTEMQIDIFRMALAARMAGVAIDVTETTGDGEDDAESAPDAGEPAADTGNGQATKTQSRRTRSFKTPEDIDPDELALPGPDLWKAANSKGASLSTILLDLMTPADPRDRFNLPQDEVASLVASLKTYMVHLEEYYNVEGYNYARGLENTYVPYRMHFTVTAEPGWFTRYQQHDAVCEVTLRLRKPQNAAGVVDEKDLIVLSASPSELGQTVTEFHAAMAHFAASLKAAAPIQDFARVGANIEQIATMARRLEGIRTHKTLAVGFPGGNKIRIRFLAQRAGTERQQDLQPVSRLITAVVLVPKDGVSLEGLVKRTPATRDARALADAAAVVDRQANLELAARDGRNCVGEQLSHDLLRSMNCAYDLVAGLGIVPGEVPVLDAYTLEALEATARFVRETLALVGANGDTLVPRQAEYEAAREQLRSSFRALYPILSDRVTLSHPGMAQLDLTTDATEVALTDGEHSTNEHEPLEGAEPNLAIEKTKPVEHSASAGVPPPNVEDMLRRFTRSDPITVAPQKLFARGETNGNASPAAREQAPEKPKESKSADKDIYLDAKELTALEAGKKQAEDKAKALEENEAAVRAILNSRRETNLIITNALQPIRDQVWYDAVSAFHQAFRSLAFFERLSGAIPTELDKRWKCARQRVEHFLAGTACDVEVRSFYAPTVFDARGDWNPPRDFLFRVDPPADRLVAIGETCTRLAPIPPWMGPLKQRVAVDEVMGYYRVDMREATSDAGKLAAARLRLGEAVATHRRLTDTASWRLLAGAEQEVRVAELKRGLDSPALTVKRKLLVKDLAVWTSDLEKAAEKPKEPGATALIAVLTSRITTGKQQLLMVEDTLRALEEGEAVARAKRDALRGQDPIAEIRKQVEEAACTIEDVQRQVERHLARIDRHRILANGEAMISFAYRAPAMLLDERQKLIQHTDVHARVLGLRRTPKAADPEDEEEPDPGCTTGHEGKGSDQAHLYCHDTDPVPCVPGRFCRLPAGNQHGVLEVREIDLSAAVEGTGLTGARDGQRVRAFLQIVVVPTGMSPEQGLLDPAAQIRVVPFELTPRAPAAENSARLTSTDIRALRGDEARRREAEVGREKAETKRVAAETGRTDAEKGRDKAEKGRKDAEKVRIAGENDRQAKELLRRASETARDVKYPTGK